MTFTNPGTKYDVLAEIADERSRQDEKWGEQNPPDGTGGPSRQGLARIARETCDTEFMENRGTWRHILAEEYAEALAEEPGTDALRTELIQVAAVAVAWVEALDRRRARGEGT